MDTEALDLITAEDFEPWQLKIIGQPLFNELAAHLVRFTQGDVTSMSNTFAVRATE